MPSEIFDTFIIYIEKTPRQDRKSCKDVIFLSYLIRCYIVQGCTNSGLLLDRSTKFCMVALNIFGSSLRNLKK